ncbi:IucA/IucC family siderophore biosynthesis protein [Pusillimonas sp. ANT_WB101]|uniref:IucA/IucC family protein n=1 Tax=Pusillimonas sp. ANT_WB101 TaxID=2597356 RepID=UPI0011EFE6B0|nr:IucA/IucC family siderophore biosynthesis protein [Pusillimonas sp. ANT_WB101]KAA0911425.1 IucA/IucC family siderophore biosynthesis protein [Pusillimonas sp. ANT_WB101]
MDPATLVRLSQQPKLAVTHLTPEIWAASNRQLVRKALSEYSHELILTPVLQESKGEGLNLYQVKSDDERTTYTFSAQILELRHWHIKLDSIIRERDGQMLPLDALQFVIDVRARLAIKDEFLPIYLDEISSTLYSAAYKLTKADSPTAAELAQNEDFQRIETAMIEGHPSFVANNGRLGFSAIDYRVYAPEVGMPVRLIWLAVHRDNATFASLADLTYDRLMREELGTDTVVRFSKIVRDLQCDPANYYFMPAHPWQWHNKLSIAFAPYVSTRKIICLDYGQDEYLAQQSIRTFFNVSDHSKRYVKTSLSILNMGFMRGLSPYYMSGTPAINHYINGVIKDDEYLRNNGFSILQEVASLGFRNYYYEDAIAADSPYKKMYSALWRENPLTRLRSGEKLMTMAALLHVDQQRVALLPELIRRSGLDVQTWLRFYLRAYLMPLLHCFYRHNLVFMPHGENLILVMKNCVPVRVIMKDIAEESAVLNIEARAHMPDLVKRLAVDVPNELKLLAIFIDVFDGVLRYVNQILVDNLCCDEDTFWKSVADCVTEYQASHPEDTNKFAEYDMFAPEFLHSCLNRLQLSNNLQMVNLADPAANLKIAGNLRNPIARFRTKSVMQHSDVPIAE